MVVGPPVGVRELTAVLAQLAVKVSNTSSLPHPCFSQGPASTGNLPDEETEAAGATVQWQREGPTQACLTPNAAGCGLRRVCLSHEWIHWDSFFTRLPSFSPPPSGKHSVLQLQRDRAISWPGHVCSCRGAAPRVRDQSREIVTTVSSWHSLPRPQSLQSRAKGSLASAGAGESPPWGSPGKSGARPSSTCCPIAGTQATLTSYLENASHRPGGQPCLV